MTTDILTSIHGSRIGLAEDGGLVMMGADGKTYKVLNAPTEDATVSGAELNRVADVSARLVSVTAATLAVSEATHEGKTIVLNKADGQAVTLPAATGSGAIYTFAIGTTITSVGTTIKVTGNDVMFGQVFGEDGDGEPANSWPTAADSDTITLDGSTKGGYKGDTIILQDFAADSWLVKGFITQSGIEATPFSATVT